MLNSTSLPPDHPNKNLFEFGISMAANRVLYVINQEIHLSNEFSLEGFYFSCVSHKKALNEVINERPGIILISYDTKKYFDEYVKGLKKFASEHAVPFILFSPKFNNGARKAALRYGFDDYYCGNLTKSFLKKAQLIRKLKEYKKRGGSIQKIYDKKLPKPKMWGVRRASDILISSTILLLLFPVLLIIAVVIKLESPGPVFYISKRAGNNYRIFDFYKFRSMRNGSDAELKKLQNQYKESVFFKVKDDPRVTKFGAFLRRTSLDEIPQLINVLKGDMSLVGNRPLPLYEAEQLTKDEIALRFLAPAGITGLWQITKRGREEMSEAERIELDMMYAENWSFYYDMKILLNTFPALIQKENV